MCWFCACIILLCVWVVIFNSSCSFSLSWVDKVTTGSDISEFFLADWYIHGTHEGSTIVDSKKKNFQMLKMHSLALSTLRFSCQRFSRLLKLTLHYIRGWFLKNSYIQIKNLYSYRLVRAATWAERMQQVVQMESHKEVWTVYIREKANIWVIHKRIYMNENTIVDSFSFRFDIFSSHCFSLLSAFLSSKPFWNN